jgi:hypothetical protein
MSAELLTLDGSCHCGAVRFEVRTPPRPVVYDCNCSICVRTGFLHLIVPRERFRILSGAGNLTTYTFNTGTARHTFCRGCGVKSFYVPRSDPECWSVNVRCLDAAALGGIEIRPFDGRDWEASMAGKSEGLAGP